MGGIILTLLVFTPILGAVLAYASGRYAREVSLLVSMLPLAITVYLFLMFDYSSPGYQFKEVYQWIPATNFRVIFGVDGLSLPMVFLTALLTTCSIIFSWDTHGRVDAFFAMLLLLETGLLGVFITLDFFLFYIFWEVVLVPMYFLINVWGGEISRKEAHYAAIKFFIYTHVASVIMLLAFIAMYFQAGGTSFAFEDIQRTAPGWDRGIQSILFVALFFGFGVKMPLVPFHTWLPDAHVQAPTAGSVMLAGVLLKMGGYGLIRIAVFMLPEGAKAFLPGLFAFAVVSMIYAALLCIAQTDLKRLVAYSSIGHMGLVLLGVSAYVAVGSEAGLKGGYFQMFAHGLITAVLFMFCGSVLHKAGTRDIRELGGIARHVPLLATVMVFGSLASLGLPGLASFPSEISVFLGTWDAVSTWTFIPVAAVVLTAAYYIWMLQRAIFGRLNPRFKGMPDLHVFEIVPYVFLMVLIAVFGVFPDVIMSMVPLAGGG